MKKLLAAIVTLLFLSLYANAQNVGIDVNSPVEKLEVNGNIKADTLKPRAIKFTPNAGQGKILISDASGNAAWGKPEKMIFKAAGFSGYTTINAGIVNKVLINWNSIAIDINANSLSGGGLFNNASGDYFVLKAGVYRVSVKIHVWDGNGNGSHTLRIFANAFNVAEQIVPQNNTVQCLQLSTVLSLFAQDKISFRYSNSSNSSVTIANNVSNNDDHEFVVEKID
jgi:hypothetical protein